LYPFFFKKKLTVKLKMASLSVDIQSSSTCLLYGCVKDFAFLLIAFTFEMTLAMVTNEPD